jgi:hypothetical protein
VVLGAAKFTPKQVYYRLAMAMQPMSLLELLLNNPEWALVGVGILTLFVIGWQAVATARAAKASQRAAEATQASTAAIEQQVRIMDRQTVATEKAAEAANDSAIAANKNIEMFISKERAKLRVDLKKLSLEPKSLSVYTVDFAISIHGTTTAYITETGCTAHFLPAEQIGSPETGVGVISSLSSLPKAISPNTPPIEQFAIFHLGGTQGAEAIVSEIKSDKLFVEIRGFIKYKDVFDRDREIRFRYVWKFTRFLWSLGKTGERYGSWEICGSPEDNMET